MSVGFTISAKAIKKVDLTTRAPLYAVAEKTAENSHMNRTISSDTMILYTPICRSYSVSFWSLGRVDFWRPPKTRFSMTTTATRSLTAMSFDRAPRGFNSCRNRWYKAMIDTTAVMVTTAWTTRTTSCDSAMLESCAAHCFASNTSMLTTKARVVQSIWYTPRERTCEA